MEYINKNRLLSNAQFGFRKGSATQDAVLALQNYILNSFENKKKAACIYFDLTRAFDTVDHTLLINKMYKYGVRGPALNWISTYLENRFQRVKLQHGSKSFISNPRFVSSGVPQGSILGPLLFVIFINDIELSTRSMFTSLYADDSTFGVHANSIPDLSVKSSEAVRSMQSYCRESGLKLNSIKTNLMCFSLRQIDRSLLVKIDNESIKQSNVVNYLGVTIDSSLSWVQHIDCLSNKLSKHCFVIWQLRNFVNKDILKMYYFGHIQSILSYCIVCWGNCNRINEVLIVQKKIIRTILFKSCRSSCRSLFVELGILTVVSLYILNCVVYIKSHINNFKSRTDTCLSAGYDLRENLNLNIPTHTLSCVSKGPNIIMIKLYNKLPVSIRKINILQIFKNRVKSLLLSKSFYSIEEYFDFTF